MYFPQSHYIPFIKDVDKCVVEHANMSSFKQHGSRLVEVVSEQLSLNSELEKHFTTLVKAGSIEEFNIASVHAVYLEAMQYSNTRVP